MARRAPTPCGGRHGNPWELADSSGAGWIEQRLGRRRLRPDFVPSPSAATQAARFRLPAALCGLFGLKTTVGLWPTDGVFSPCRRRWIASALLTRSARGRSACLRCG